MAQIMVSIATSSFTEAQKSSATNRIPAFDFTKGVLVLFMVVYHWLNYFYAPTGYIYRYLRFLTPSFIFITGFLISHVHFIKYGTGSRKLSKRLFLRGAKLLGVFVLLNLMIGFLIPNSPIRTAFSERPTLENIEAILLNGYIYGDSPSTTASFAILLPISYLLIISAVFQTAGKMVRHIFQILCALLLLIFVPMLLNGLQSYNLELLLFGLLGIVCGYWPKSKVQKFTSNPSAVIAAYCAYLAAITVWDVPFPLRIAGVFLTLTIIYMVGAKSDEATGWQGRILVLGKYSLLGYISQIAILQVLHRALNKTDLGVGVLTLSLVAGFALTIITVELVDWIRPKVSIVDRIYRAVFA